MADEKMADEKKFVIGVDLGGTNVRAAVLERASERIVARGENLPARGMDGPDATAGQIALASRNAMTQAGVTSGEISGVGIALPGHVKPTDGMVLWAPNFKDQWKRVPIAKLVADKLDNLPVYLGNDANLAALGEFTFGVGRKVRHLIMLTMGTGIGGGIIIDGKLVEGADGGAGEVGHIIVNPGGRGGNAAFGSLEGECQISAIVERCARKIQSGRTSVLTEKIDFDRFLLTPALIAEAAASGDAVARETFDETGYFMGIAVASLINLFNPEMVVIGGGVAQSGQTILAPIRRASDAVAIRSLARSCQIVGAELGDNAGILGAAALAMQSAA